jgi:hypothetical protein
MVEDRLRREALKYHGPGYPTMESAIRAAMALAPVGMDRAALAAEVARSYHTAVLTAQESMPSGWWAREARPGYRKRVRAWLRGQVDRMAAERGMVLVAQPWVRVFANPPPMPGAEGERGIPDPRYALTMEQQDQPQADAWVQVVMVAWARELPDMPDERGL